MRIKKLFDLRYEYEKSKNIELAMDNIKPKVFWKDRPIFSKQIKIWNLKKLKDAKELHFNAEMTIKTKLSGYNEVIIKNLLIKLYKKAVSTS